MKLDESRAAVVTGGASGLGEASARMLASAGARVAILDMNQERGERVAGETGAVFCRADVTDEASIDAALEAARARNGVERILVNCAGIAPGKRTVAKKRDTGELVAHDLASFRRAVEINLIGTYAMISKCAAAMAGLDPVTRDGGRGVIVNTSSVAAQDGQIGQAAYSASKGGVLGMTLPVARDLAAVGVRVNCIAPGLIDTPIYGSGEASEAFKAKLGESVLFPRRLGQADEFASLALELLTNDYMNAETIRLDGGIRMPPK